MEERRPRVRQEDDPEGKHNMRTGKAVLAGLIGRIGRIAPIGLICGIAGLACPGFAADARQPRPSALSGVAGLAKPVTDTETKIPPGTLIRWVAAEIIAKPCASLLRWAS